MAPPMSSTCRALAASATPSMSFASHQQVGVHQPQQPQPAEPSTERLAQGRFTSALLLLGQSGLTACEIHAVCLLAGNLLAIGGDSGDMSLWHPVEGGVRAAAFGGDGEQPGAAWVHSNLPQTAFIPYPAPLLGFAPVHSAQHAHGPSPQARPGLHEDMLMLSCSPIPWPPDKDAPFRHPVLPAQATSLLPGRTRGP